MMEKGWRRKLDEVKDKIMDGYRRGVCNKNGDSIKHNGMPVAKPRVLSSTVKHFLICDKCHKCHEIGKPCGC